MKIIIFCCYVLLAFSIGAKGVLCLTFDDRNFDSWINALPILKQYNAHVSFFPYGSLGEYEKKSLKILSDAGHTIGTHTVDPLDVPSAMHHWWTRIFFFNRQLKPHIETLGECGIPVRHFAYPFGRRTEETDHYLSKYFMHLRGTAHYRYQELEGGGIVQLDDVFFTVSKVQSRLYLPGIGVGDFYKTDIEDLKKGIRRIAERDEVLVLFSHAIVQDEIADSGVNMRISELIELCKTATECGVLIKGFDEL